MNDAEYEAQKARIEALAETWLKPLGLLWWKVGFEYFRDVLPSPHENALAVCYPDWRYLRANIWFSLAGTAEQSDVMLEWAFVHELMHVFLSEMSADGDVAMDHEERVASHLADAFLFLREHLTVGLENRLTSPCQEAHCTCREN